jgi:hypothetical protein
LTFAQLVGCLQQGAWSDGGRAAPCADAVAPERGLVVSTTYTLPDASVLLWRACRSRGGEPRDGTGHYPALRWSPRLWPHRQPRLVEGQIIGGIAQGLGQALTEDLSTARRVSR